MDPAMKFQQTKRKTSSPPDMSRKVLLLSLLTLAALLLRSGSGVEGHLNVFLNPVEVMRLLGESPSSLPPSLGFSFS